MEFQAQWLNKKKIIVTHQDFFLQSSFRCLQLWKADIGEEKASDGITKKNSFGFIGNMCHVIFEFIL